VNLFRKMAKVGPARPMTRDPIQLCLAALSQRQGLRALAGSKVITMAQGNSQRQVAHLQKFRRTYPRLDYFPDKPAYAAIERMRQAHPGRSIRLLIDTLVIAGGKVRFPESAKNYG
jgi:hypothetical protein